MISFYKEAAMLAIVVGMAVVASRLYIQPRIQTACTLH